MSGFSIEYAKTGRSRCTGDCKELIGKGVLRLGKTATGFRHWSCVTPFVLKSIGHVELLLGYDSINQEDRDMIVKMFDATGASAPSSPMPMPVSMPTPVTTPAPIVTTPAIPVTPVEHSKDRKRKSIDIEMTVTMATPDVNVTGSEKKKMKSAKKEKKEAEAMAMAMTVVATVASPVAPTPVRVLPSPLPSASSLQLQQPQSISQPMAVDYCLPVRRPGPTYDASEPTYCAMCKVKCQSVFNLKAHCERAKHQRNIMYLAMDPSRGRDRDRASGSIPAPVTPVTAVVEKPKRLLSDIKKERALARMRKAADSSASTVAVAQTPPKASMEVAPVPAPVPVSVQVVVPVVTKVATPAVTPTAKAITKAKKTVVTPVVVVPTPTRAPAAAVVEPKAKKPVVAVVPIPTPIPAPTTTTPMDIAIPTPTTPTHPPIAGFDTDASNTLYPTSQSLEQFGLSHLKQELLSRQLKCGGTLEQRAARLFAIKNKITNKAKTENKTENKTESQGKSKKGGVNSKKPAHVPVVGPVVVPIPTPVVVTAKINSKANSKKTKD